MNEEIKRNSGGRPPLPKDQRRSVRVMSRLTEPTYFGLQLAIESYNTEHELSGKDAMTTSTYIEMCVKNNKRIQRQMRRLNELSNL